MWTLWSLQSQFHSIWVKCLHHVVWSLWIAHLLHLQTHLPSLLTAIESTFAPKAMGFTQVSLFMIIYSMNSYAVPKVEMLWSPRWHFLISFLWMISWLWKIKFHSHIKKFTPSLSGWIKASLGTLLLLFVVDEHGHSTQSLSCKFICFLCEYTTPGKYMFCSLHVHYTQQHVHSEFLALGMQKYYYTMTFDLCCDIIYI